MANIEILRLNWGASHDRLSLRHSHWAEGVQTRGGGGRYPERRGRCSRPRPPGRPVFSSEQRGGARSVFRGAVESFFMLLCFFMVDISFTGGGNFLQGGGAAPLCAPPSYGGASGAGVGHVPPPLSYVFA